MIPSLRLVFWETTKACNLTLPALPRRAAAAARADRADDESRRST